MTAKTYHARIDDNHTIRLALRADDTIELDIIYESGDSGSGVTTLYGTGTWREHTLTITFHTLEDSWWDLPDHGGERDDFFAVSVTMTLERTGLNLTILTSLPHLRITAPLHLTPTR